MIPGRRTSVGPVALRGRGRLLVAVGPAPSYPR